MIIVFGIVLFLATIGVCMSIKSYKSSNKVLTPSTTPVKNTSILGESTASKHLKKKPLFIQIWRLEEFCKKFDRMQYGNPTNRTTGESFKSCRFFKEGKPITYVGFYRVPGELSSEELKRRTKELKVGLKESGRYLIFTGDIPYYEESDHIDLGILD